MTLKTLITASDFLHEADATLNKRAADRDVKQERSMADIVKVFNILCGTELTEAEGWAFMTILKLKRSMVGDRYKEDDFVDGPAYFALYGEARRSQAEAEKFLEKNPKED